MGAFNGSLHLPPIRIAILFVPPKVFIRKSEGANFGFPLLFFNPNRTRDSSFDGILTYVYFFNVG